MSGNPTLQDFDRRNRQGLGILCRVPSDMATPSQAKWFAGLTIFFGLPLYFTKLIRETRIAEGFLFVFIYTWGLVAVVALPVSLLAQLYFLVRALRRGSEASERRLLFFSSFAFCFGLIAECIFVLARR
jgi:hypothetical protein